MARIVFTGGGTGGHVTPNQVLIPHLQAKGHEIHYIGTQDSIEQRLIQAMPSVAFHAVRSGKLRRYFDIKNFTDPFKVLYGAGEAFALIGSLKPKLVFSKGGFVSVPVVLAAAMRRVAVLCHESDLTPGLANKLTAPHARKVLTTFEPTAALFGDKGVFTGTPLRPALRGGDAAAGYALCGFTPARPMVLCMGGSSGATAINRALRQALGGIAPHLQVAHICGRGNVAPELEGLPGYKQFDYVDEALPHLLAAAKAVVSRAGSGSIQELLWLQKPMLLIPLPASASRGDQIENAALFERRGVAFVLPQEHLTGDSLRHALRDILDNAEKLKQAMRAQPSPDGTRRVLDQIEALL